MKLNSYETSLDEKLSEFDLWVTPSLGEIRDTPQFKINLELLKNGFDLLAEITGNFKDISSCSSTSLASNAIVYIAGKDGPQAKEALDSICNVLLLATGKTDNNLKCQFPLLLTNTYNLSNYPQKTVSGQWRNKALPRTLSLGDVTKIIVQLSGQEEYQKVFTASYFHLIISDEIYAKQLWSLGSSYISQKVLGNADSLISSIVIFQSRGSITATQGHIPETILRTYMADWGLEAGKDFNTQDVEIGELLEGIPADNTIKKRKYDFIIPFQSRKDGAKVFIQSQYYAGDSGSVSHKVVDQTDSSREVTLRKYPQAVFIEFLDGAGYFSSLNGDLRKMLAKPTTKDFIQIKTAPIKLRRELQDIHFLTALEIEHAILRTSGNRADVTEILLLEGYSTDEILMAIDKAVRSSCILLSENGQLSIKPDRIDIVRKYCLLDLIANLGQPIPDDKGAGYLIVAGYKIAWGLPQADLIEAALNAIPTLDTLWGTKIAPFNDIQWLLDKGFIKTK
ncbi:hypothetical protein [Methanobacterium sp.]|uniref:hypothetical protein n=1 Tax=Methanobacterium sp. TaxID=2164 RepID=UPI003158EC04